MYGYNELMQVCEVKLTYKPKVKRSELPKIGCSDDVKELMNGLFDELTVDYRETFCVAYLNTAYRVTGVSRLFEGGMDSVNVDIRILMQHILLSNARAIVIAHNHPSGNRRPSVEDDKLTQKVKDACNFFNIKLLDHVIIADGDYYSYCDEGRL